MRADALVLFGATGDLARKKLFPALYQLATAKQLGVPVIGVAVSDWDDTQMRAFATQAVQAANGHVDGAALDELVTGLAIVSGDYRDRSTFAALASRLAEAGAVSPVYYLAIPPTMFPVVVEGLASTRLSRGARVVVEKPFGRDLASATELNRVLLAAFPERSVCSAYSAGLPCSPAPTAPRMPRSSSCVIRSPCSSGRSRRRGCPGPTGRSWPRWPGCCPRAASVGCA